MNRPVCFLSLAALCLLSVQCKKQDDFLILPLVLAQDRLEISFNGRSFADEPSPDPEPAFTLSAYKNPEFQDACLLSHPPGFYGSERGLKFRLCMPEMNHAAEALAENASVFRGRVELGEYTKSTLPEITALTVIRARSQNIAIRTQREILRGSLAESDLPSSFPDWMPVIAVEEQTVSFLYLRGTRILSLRVHDASIAGRFQGAIAQTEHAAQLRPGPAADVFVSEIYFSSQGSPFVELSSETDGAMDTVLVSDLGERVELRGQIFAGAAVVVPISFKSRIDIAAGGLSKSILESAQPRGAGKSHSRSADFPGGKDNLLPSIQCMDESQEGPACHSRGIGPAYLRTATDSARFCRPEDLKLTELNPFGFETNGSLNPAGKFLEFEVTRECYSGRIVLYAPLELDVGNRKLAPETRLVFAADSQFFSSSVIENSRLRSLSPESPVQVVSLVDQKSSTQFAGFPAADLWIPRAAGRVHSLIMENSRALFHGPLSAGLRPDVDAAMSPGVPFEQPCGSVRLNELYPTGAFDSSSIPGDEFFETTGTSGAGLFALEVVRLRDEKRVVHRFPASENITAYFAGPPVCFDTPFTRAVLFLPNEAARYTLRDSNGALIDEVEISPALYTAMEKDRRSLGQPWTLSAQGGRCLRSAASPGKPNEAAP